MIVKAMFQTELDNNTYFRDSENCIWYVLDNDGNWIKEITASRNKKLNIIYNEWVKNGK